MSKTDEQFKLGGDLVTEAIKLQRDYRNYAISDSPDKVIVLAQASDLLMRAKRLHTQNKILDISYSEVKERVDTILNSENRDTTQDNKPTVRTKKNKKKGCLKIIIWMIIIAIAFIIIKNLA